jgi:hypothetical protein
MSTVSGHFGADEGEDFHDIRKAHGAKIRKMHEDGFAARSHARSSLASMRGRDHNSKLRMTSMGADVEVREFPEDSARWGDAVVVWMENLVMGR